jgi:AraC family transcriptional regulator
MTTNEFLTIDRVKLTATPKFLSSPMMVPKYDRGLPSIKLRQALEYIDNHLSQNISLVEIARQIDMSQHYFCRSFKQSIGITPHQYLIQQRVERAKQLLIHSELTILDITDECGFANPSHFAKYFRQHTGISPRQFRSQAQDYVRQK